MRTVGRDLDVPDFVPLGGRVPPFCAADVTTGTMSAAEMTAISATLRARRSREKVRCKLTMSDVATGVPGTGSTGMPGGYRRARL